MKRKNRHWYNLKQEYNLAEFLVRMIVGTGLRFEIWSLDGQIRSQRHEEWKSANSGRCVSMFLANRLPVAVQWVDPDVQSVKSTKHRSDAAWSLSAAMSSNMSELFESRNVYELSQE